MPMAVKDPIYLNRDGAVGTIHLNRPDKRNALNGAMWQRLATLIAEADADPQIKVIVITGEGQAFAAGADIDEFNAVFTDPSAAETTAAITYQAQKALHRNLKPTIAKIRGACVGGGCGIALCCDLRFADTSAKLGITPGKLGLIYSLSDTKRLVDLVGPAKAKDILYTGRILGAEEALSIGLIDRLVAPEALDETVNAFAAEICAASQFSARGTKRITQMILDGADDDTAETRALFVEAFSGADFKEGFTAFGEKRKPKFTA
ncbi:MAG: enoyl-CoA hydratase/isomerase family protein [Rhodobacteraceae bacterium]|nr:enoyl-CoA hydratase/isomerase family protein [Paracoccaceae bacterium]